MTSNGEEDVGLAIVRSVYSRWQVDPEWSVWEERGFAWWGHHHRQRIWSSPAVADEGTAVYRVCAETELLEAVPASAETYVKLGVLSTLADVSSFVFRSDTGRLTAFCGMYVAADSAEWLGELFGGTAILQPAQAELKANTIQRVIGGRLWETEHPKSGPRPAADEMLDVVPRLYAPAGRLPSPWSDTDEFDRLAELLNRGNCFATSSTNGLSAEFPLGAHYTSLLQLLPAAPHPTLGNGLLILLRTPSVLAQEEMAEIVVGLNRGEADGGNACHQLGSWAVEKVAERDGGLTYVSFLPNVVYRPGLMTHLALDMAKRAAWLGEITHPGEKPGSAVDLVARRLSERS